MPSMSVPPSPMNIFDFTPNTLCMKKGISAPTTIRVIQTMMGDHVDQNMMPKQVHASMPYPDE